MLTRGALKYQKPGRRWQHCYETIDKGCPGEPPTDPVVKCAKLDLVFLFGPGNDVDFGNWSEALSDVQQFALDVDAEYDDYRLAFAYVERNGTVVIAEPLLDLENVTAFNTAVDGVPDIAGWTLATNIDGGLEDCVDGTVGTFRSGDLIQRQIIVVTDSTETIVDNLKAQAAIGLAATDSITTHTLRTSYSDDGTPTAEPGWTALGQVLSETATAGGGSYNTFLSGAGLSLAYYLFHLVLENICFTEGGTYGDPSTAHRHCCPTNVCDLCLRFTDDYGNVTPGIANLQRPSHKHYVDFELLGSEVRFVWRLRGRCALFVYVDDDVVGVFPKCDSYGNDAQRCRKPAGTVFNVKLGTGYQIAVGTLVFFTYEPLRLKRVIENNCATKFCGHPQFGPDCTCATLCVTVTDQTRTCAGIWPAASYQTREIGVSDPQWAGDSLCTGGGKYTGRIFLVRDGYRNCVLFGFVRNSVTGLLTTLPPQVVTGDQTTSATWTIGYVKVTATCGICGSCLRDVTCEPCCIKDEIIPYAVTWPNCTRFGPNFGEFSPGEVELFDTGACGIWAGDLHVDPGDPDLCLCPGSGEPPVLDLPCPHPTMQPVLLCGEDAISAYLGTDFDLPPVAAGDTCGHMRVVWCHSLETGLGNCVVVEPLSCDCNGLITFPVVVPPTLLAQLGVDITCPGCDVGGGILTF